MPSTRSTLLKGLLGFGSGMSGGKFGGNTVKPAATAKLDEGKVQTVAQPRKGSRGYYMQQQALKKTATPTPVVKAEVTVKTPMRRMRRGSMASNGMLGGGKFGSAPVSK